MDLRIDLRDVNVLIVDDNRHMRRIVRSLLLTHGCKTVHEASDAAAAFKEMRSFAADIVIVEWNLEPIDGCDFVRLVRTARDSPNTYVPIIMLSGHTEHQCVAKARDVGVNEFLAKPISGEALGGRIASILRHPREFIRTKKYFGPCRRRRDLGPPRGMAERRVSAAVVANERPLHSPASEAR